MYGIDGVQAMELSLRSEVVELDGSDADVALDLQGIGCGISCSVNEFAVLLSVKGHLKHQFKSICPRMC
jgi:hypothetical protein